PDRMGPLSLPRRAPLQLDLDVNPGGEVELHQRVNRLRRWIDDIEQPLMGTHFELLAALLVDMRRAVHGEFFDPGRQRDGPPHLGPGSLGRVDDLFGRRIEDAMVEGFQPDSYVLTLHLTASNPEARRLPAARFPISLLYDRRHDARADGAAAFANG